MATVGYEGNPYVLNIVPLFGSQQSASGSSALQQIQEMVNYDTKTINANTIASFDTGTVQFTSPIVQSGDIASLTALIATLEARIVSLEARVLALGG